MPSAQVPAASRSGGAFPAGNTPCKAKAGGVTSRVQAILRPNSIWQTVPIGNQCPSLGGFNFMAVCTNLQLLIGRAELRASSQGCSDGV